MPLTTLFLDKVPTAALLESEEGGNVSTQKDMPDLRIEPATFCTAVERGYDRASQAGIYFTMTLNRRTNSYDQDLCVLSKNSLIWIYTVFYAYTWPFKVIDNVVYYIPPQVSGRVFCFHVGCL